MKPAPYPAKLHSLPSNISSIPIEKRRIIFDLIQQHDLRDCLEAGFANGVSSIVIASATKGSLLTFDHPVAQHNTPSIEQLIEQFGQTNITPQYCADYAWEFGKLVKQGRTFDFIFIDASHLFLNTVAGIALADRLLRRNGYLVLDDISWIPTVSSPITFEEVRKYNGYVNEEEWRSAPVGEAFDCLLKNSRQYRCDQRERMAVCQKLSSRFLV